MASVRTGTTRKTEEEEDGQKEKGGGDEWMVGEAAVRSRKGNEKREKTELERAPSVCCTLYVVQLHIRASASFRSMNLE